MKKNKWTEPKIKAYPDLSKDWYVWFRFNGGNPKRYSFGINTYNTYEQRMIHAELLCKTLLLNLQNGWNPDLNKTSDKKPKKMSIADGLSFSMDKLKQRLKSKSYSDYLCTNRFVLEAVMRLKYDKLSIQSIERYHIKTIMEDIKTSRNWSNHAYNKNLGYLKSILSELVEFDIIKTNPAHGIRLLKYETPPTLFPTDQEQTKIIQHLYNRNFTYLRFVKALYQTGIRPAELLRLKVGDVDLDRDLILLKSEDGKTNKYRLVPIKSDLKKDLLLIINSTHSPDLYLFGTPRKQGGKLDYSDMFSPNKYKIKRDTVTKYWKKYVKDELGITKNLYSLKHKAANDMMFDGLDLETIQTIFGHSKSKTTEIYANQINLLRFEKAKKLEREFV